MDYVTKCYMAILFSCRNIALPDALVVICLWHGVNDVTEEQVQRAVERLNHRPRKVLGFRSLHEALFGVEMRSSKATLVVAL